MVTRRIRPANRNLHNEDMVTKKAGARIALIGLRRTQRGAVLRRKMFKQMAELVGVLIQSSPAQLEDESLEPLGGYWTTRSLVSLSASRL